MFQRHPSLDHLHLELGRVPYSVFACFWFNDEIQFSWASSALVMTRGVLLMPFTIDAFMTNSVLSIVWHCKFSKRRIRDFCCRRLRSSSHRRCMFIGVTLLTHQGQMKFVVLALECVIQQDGNSQSLTTMEFVGRTIQIQRRIFSNWEGLMQRTLWIWPTKDKHAYWALRVCQASNCLLFFYLKIISNLCRLVRIRYTILIFV